MVNRIGIRLGLVTLGVATVTALMGCGNGLEVGGPAPRESSVLASPTTPTKHRSPNPDQPTSTSAKPVPHKTPSPSAQPASAGQGQDKSGATSSHESSRGDSNGSRHSGTSVSSCALGDLEIGVKVPAGGGTAGSQYVLIRYTNTSATPCTMYGYAGVSFVGHQNGTQLGNPAERAHSQVPQTIRLEPGDATSELLQIVDAGNFPPQECVPTTSDGFRIYPPESYTAAYVPFETSACQGTKVTQLTVFPVGTKN